MKTRQVGRGLARYLFAGALSAVLVGCGGGGGDDDPIDGDIGGDIGGGFDNDDVDGDGILNFEDDDFDPADLDPDGNGVPNRDEPGYTRADLDNDGIPNLEDSDVDGDGVLNEEDDDFVENDADGDGFSDISDNDACGGEQGTDPDSSNFTWDDNCTVRREGQAPGEGQFADSLYAAGIQRVVYCAGFGEASSVEAFTDGEYGPGSEAAVVAFQTDRGLAADGEVGPQTWGALQDELVEIERGTFGADGIAYDGYGVPGERCGDDILFYNATRLGEDGISVDRLGWELAQSPGSSERIPFSISGEIGLVD